MGFTNVTSEQIAVQLAAINQRMAARGMENAALLAELSMPVERQDTVRWTPRNGVPGIATASDAPANAKARREARRRAEGKGPRR